MESTLSIKRSHLLDELGRFAGWNAEVSKWTETQSRDADRIIARALRQAYGPPVLPGESTAHAWSFLRPVHTFSTKPNVGEYPLPDDFGGLVGQLAYAGSDAGNATLSKISVEQLLINRQAHQDTVGFPSFYAVAPIATNGVTPQRFTLYLDPAAADVYRLRFRYRSNPYNLSAGATFPLGGQAFADCLHKSVLAAADEMLNDNYMGATWARFIDALRTAVSHDRQEFIAGNLGYNGDPGMGPTLYGGSRDTAFTINDASYASEGFFFDE